LCLRHSEKFQLTYSYLLKCFSNNKRTLALAQKEAVTKGILEIKKVNKYNYYAVKDMSEWNIKAEVLDEPQGDNSHGEISHGEISHGDNSHPIIRSTPNKTKNHKTNVCNKEKPHTHWTCDYSPQSIVDALAEHGIIKRNKGGFVPNIKTWNRITESELAGLNQGELEQFISWTREELRGQFLKLENGNLQKLRAACFAEEKTLEYEEQQDIEEIYEVEYNQKPLDDIPF
jgi:hypothetical protein